MSLQQLNSQFLFQLLYLIPQPGLGNPEIAAGSSKTAMTNHGNKVPNLPDIHESPRCLIPMALKARHSKSLFLAILTEV
jgi:hypothetical protein